jgi:hypothetical protein
VRLGVFLPALLVAFPAFSFGRIAGTVDFKGRALKPVTVSTPDPACKGAVVPWERRALVRLTKNAPPGAAPNTPVILEQKGCTYRPWLQGAVRGQKILLRNSDGTTHSVRADANGRTLFNVIQPPGAKDLAKDPIATDLVKIGCDLHPWMKAFVVISDHPFFAVTAADGSFELKDVPAGTYGIEAWNERLGFLRGEVTVEDGKSVDPKLSFTVR